MKTVDKDGVRPRGDEVVGTHKIRGIYLNNLMALSSFLERSTFHRSLSIFPEIKNGRIPWLTFGMQLRSVNLSFATYIARVFFHLRGGRK